MKKPNRGNDMGAQRGFTLLELMIVVTLLAIVSSIGVPMLRDVILNNRQVATVNELVTAMQMARSEAITRNIGWPAAVSICGSNTRTNCAGDWSDGWIVFVDNNGNGGFDAGDEVIRAFEAAAALDIFGGAVSYRRNGRVDDPRDFQVCDSRGGSKARVIQLGLSGRPSVSKTLSGGGAPGCTG